MRITRSTLNRLIAEESARLLREAAFPEEIEAQYGRGREEEEEERGSRMLHITYQGGSYEGGGGFPNVNYIVTDFQANPLGEEAENVTEEITGGEDLSVLEDALALKDWLLSHTEVGYVVNEEQHDPETDDSDTAEAYLSYLDKVIAAEEEEAFGDKGAEMYLRAVERGEDMGSDDEDLFEGEEEEEDDVAGRQGRGHRTDESAGKRHTSPRQRLAAYLEKQGADVAAVLRAIDGAVSRAEERGEEPNSEDVTFNLDDSVLDAIPEEHADKWHSMIDAVLADEFDADAFADAAAYSRDIEDTERDLSHPSRFLEEGEGDSDGPDQFDPDDPEFHADSEREYRSAHSFWSDEPGSSLKASHSDFDAHRGADKGVRRFITRGRQGKPHRASDGGLDIDSGDEDLSEGRWAQLAGILKG